MLAKPSIAKANGALGANVRRFATAEIKFGNSSSRNQMKTVERRVTILINQRHRKRATSMRARAYAFDSSFVRTVVDHFQNGSQHCLET